MNTQRIAVIEGDQPILFIAPHGSGDDLRTDKIAKLSAEFSRGSAVINQGWRRAADFDLQNNIANCNNVQHCIQDVVKEEFLDPILDIARRLQEQHGFCHVYNVHGVGDYIRRKANDPTLDVIIGYGAGSPPSHSCDPRLKNAMIALLAQKGVVAYEGLATGYFAGGTRDNLNQLFRVWFPQLAVESMQLEFVKTLRNDPATLATKLADVTTQLIELDDAALDAFATPSKGI